jgi:hypothetical protein
MTINELKVEDWALAATLIGFAITPAPSTRWQI